MTRPTRSLIAPRAFAVGALVLVTGACSAGAGATGSASTAPSPTVDRSFEQVSPSAAPSGEAPSGAVGIVPPELLGPALADAAVRTGAAPAAIAVIEATDVTWNDGSLGCPEPGVMYTQALVDGYRVILDAGGTRLDYRIPRNGGFKVCEGLLGG